MASDRVLTVTGTVSFHERDAVPRGSVATVKGVSTAVLLTKIDN